MCALCSSFSIARTCCPMNGVRQEFSTDGLMALTATALLKALTVHLSNNFAAPTSAALQPFLASKPYCSLPLFVFIAPGSCGTPKVSHFIFF